MGVGWVGGRGRGRQVGRSACGCAPAFGRAVGALARRVYGTAEAVPLRVCRPAPWLALAFASAISHEVRNVAAGVSDDIIRNWERIMTAKHEVNGKEYLIKSGRTDTGIEIRIYFNERLIGPSYSIAYETANDFQAISGESWESELIGIAKHDIDRGLVRG